MSKKFEFFISWYSDNKSNIIGSGVVELYKDYYIKAYESGCKPYSKKRFIKEVKIRSCCHVYKYFEEI